MICPLGDNNAVPPAVQHLANEIKGMINEMKDELVKKMDDLQGDMKSLQGDMRSLEDRVGESIILSSRVSVVNSLSVENHIQSTRYIIKCVAMALTSRTKFFFLLRDITL